MELDTDYRSNILTCDELVDYNAARNNVAEQMNLLTKLRNKMNKELHIAVYKKYGICKGDKVKISAAKSYTVIVSDFDIINIKNGAILVSIYGRIINKQGTVSFKVNEFFTSSMHKLELLEKGDIHTTLDNNKSVDDHFLCINN